MAVNGSKGKEDRRREKRERQRLEREEKTRLKEEKRALKEARKKEKESALDELRELPQVEEGRGEELRCGGEHDERVTAPGARDGLAEEEGEPAVEGDIPGEAAELLMEEDYLAEALLENEDTGGGRYAPAEDRAAWNDGGFAGGGRTPAVEEAEEPGEIALDEDGERWFSRLRKGLSKSRLNFVAPLTRAVAARRFDEGFWEEVEDILVAADVGMEMTVTLVERVRERMARDKVKDPEGLLSLFRDVLADSMEVGESGLRYSSTGPSVFMVVGVNGTGKTTTIAKLAHLLGQDGKRVLLAAGDTFRAAGVEQLEAWGERVGVHTVKHGQGADAAAVVHDAVESAIARGIDVVIADTAGRLHTKANLMEELKKIKRIAERNARVTETLLVIDATTGQNGLIQARQFGEAVDVTGVVLTKLDGTAKGGIVVAIVHELGIPIKFIGVGERIGDLHAFDAREYADALFS